MKLHRPVTWTLCRLAAVAAMVPSTVIPLNGVSARIVARGLAIVLPMWKLLRMPMTLRLLRSRLLSAVLTRIAATTSIASRALASTCVVNLLQLLWPMMRVALTSRLNLNPEVWTVFPLSNVPEASGVTMEIVATILVSLLSISTPATLPISLISTALVRRMLIAATVSALRKYASRRVSTCLWFCSVFSPDEL